MVESSQQLQTIIERCQSFLDTQLGRFDRVFNDCQEMVELESKLREQALALETEMARWQHERDEQIEQLRQEADQLAEAWASFESEQRRLLAREATLQSSGSRAFLGNGNESLAEPTSHTPLTPELAAKSQSRQAAVRQFQQLSCEIGRHTRRNK